MASHPELDQPVSLIGLPYQCGTRTFVPGQQQMARAPQLIFSEEHAVSSLREHFSDIEVVMIDDADDASPLDTGGDHRLLIVGDEMSRQLVQHSHLANAVRRARDANRIPIVWAGGCVSAPGVVGGLDDGGMGMVWFDGHHDALTPDTSRNGFMDGMPVTMIAGYCWPLYRREIPGFHEISEERIITVGNHEVYWSKGRSWPEGSRAIGTVVDPPVIAKMGYETAMANALDYVAARTDRIYVHIDPDCLDPQWLRANSHWAEGGLSPAQVHLGLRMIAERFEILGVSFMAYDPAEDPRGPEVLVPMVVEAALCAAMSRARFTADRSAPVS